MSNGTISSEADISVSTNSNPEGAGKLPVILGKGNALPDGVIPKKAVYKSSVLKLFEYNLTPKSVIASATKSLEIPKSNLLSASNLVVIFLVYNQVLSYC